jgi:hypothetical protein
MKKTILIFAIFLALQVTLAKDCFSFDKINSPGSYIGSRFLYAGAGFGFSQVVGYSGISGGPGFSFDLTIGHDFSQSLSLDFLYRVSLAPIKTNSPVNPTLKIGSTLLFNGESLRLKYKYPRYNLQPFIYAGVGIYNFTSVDSKSGLEFPLNMQIPLGIGMIYYVYKDEVSLSTSFDWQVLFGENQRQEILNLLNVQKISFDLYSVMFMVTWHVF